MADIDVIDFLDIDPLDSISEDGSLLASKSEAGPIGRISIEELRDRLLGGNVKADIYKHEFLTAETWEAVSGLSGNEIIKTVVDCSEMLLGEVIVKYGGVTKKTLVPGDVETVINKSTDIDIVSNNTDFDISKSTYDNKSKDVSAQESALQGCDFKPDGTKMYVLGQSSDAVFQYTLSTPWDVSTASYDSISFSFSNGTAIRFKPDGTKMYILSAASVYQYTLSTPWDVSTAGSPVSKSLTAEGNANAGFCISSDGTNIYICDSANDRINQYSMTAWDLSTLVYDTVNLSIAAQDNNCTGLDVTSDGNTMYLSGFQNNKVYQYDLSTAWDLSTASYSTHSYAPSELSLSIDITLKTDDDKMYLCDQDANIYQYSTSGEFAGSAFAMVIK